LRLLSPYSQYHQHPSIYQLYTSRHSFHRHHHLCPPWTKRTTRARTSACSCSSATTRSGRPATCVPSMSRCSATSSGRCAIGCTAPCRWRNPGQHAGIDSCLNCTDGTFSTEYGAKACQSCPANAMGRVRHILHNSGASGASQTLRPLATALAPDSLTHSPKGVTLPRASAAWISCAQQSHSCCGISRTHRLSTKYHLQSVQREGRDGEAVSCGNEMEVLRDQPRAGRGCVNFREKG
jgi:hypothetical protein